MDKHEAASIVALIAAAFPQWPAGRETVAVYVESFSDLPYDPTLEAVRKLIYTEDRWPTIATIRRSVAAGWGLLAPLPGEAWAEVSQRASNTHSESSWSHTAIKTTVWTLGWWNIRFSTNLETMRAQFMRIYEEQRKRCDTETLAAPGMVALDAGRRDQRSTLEAVSDVERNAT